MRPLLQHASRFHNVNVSTITSSTRPIGRFVAQSPLICVTCQYRQASSALRRIERPQAGNNGPRRWEQRQFSSSSKLLEEKKPPGSSDPIAMPPPATEHRSKPAPSADRTPEQLIERQERLRKEWEEQQRKREEALRKKQQEEEARRKREEEEALRKKREAEALQKKQEEEVARKKREEEALRKAQLSSQPKPAQPAAPRPEPTPERSSPVETQKSVQREPMVSQNKEDVVDNVKRVPDEHLPSHQERQRSNLEKRFTALMDELLPKIAVVTQKVNTYTGTDYSGVEALRREIKEQGTPMHSCTETACLTSNRKACQSSPPCD